MLETSVSLGLCVIPLPVAPSAPRHSWTLFLFLHHLSGFWSSFTSWWQQILTWLIFCKLGMLFSLWYTSDFPTCGKEKLISVYAPLFHLSFFPSFPPPSLLPSLNPSSILFFFPFFHFFWDGLSLWYSNESLSLRLKWGFCLHFSRTETTSVRHCTLLNVCHLLTEVSSFYCGLSLQAISLLTYFMFSVKLASLI